MLTEDLFIAFGGMVVVVVLWIIWSLFNGGSK